MPEKLVAGVLPSRSRRYGAARSRSSRSRCFASAIRARRRAARRDLALLLDLEDARVEGRQRRRLVPARRGGAVDRAGAPALARLALVERALKSTAASRRGTGGGGGARGAPVNAAHRCLPACRAALTATIAVNAASPRRNRGHGALTGARG